MQTGCILYSGAPVAVGRESDGLQRVLTKKKCSDAFLRHKRGKKMHLEPFNTAGVAQTAPRFQSRPNTTPSINFLSTAATSLTFTIRKATFANNKIWQFPPGTTNEFKKKSLRKSVCERLRHSNTFMEQHEVASEQIQ